MSFTLITSKYGQDTDLRSGAADALKWMIQNKQRVQMSERDIASFKDLRVITDTPIMNLYTKITRENLFSNYFIMNLSNIDDIPTILTNDEFSLDGIEFPDAPEPFQTIWINLTPILGSKRSSKSGVPVITDMPRFTGYFVRGMICLSYHDNPSWLSPSLKPFVIESFSMSARLRVAQAFNLEAEDALMVQTAFAYHYAQLISPEKEFEEYPPILNRCGFLGSQKEIEDRIKYLNDASDGNVYENGLTSVCKAIAKVGPPRMEKRFDINVFLRLFSIGNIDNTSLAISPTFPPYWTYLLLKFASGGKNALMGNLFRINYMKKNLKNWSDEVTKYRGLITKRR